MKSNTVSVHVVLVMRSIRDLQGLCRMSESTQVREYLKHLYWHVLTLIVDAEVLVHAEKEGSTGRTTPDLTLYWDSWDSDVKSPPPLASIPQHNALDTPIHNSSFAPSNSTLQNVSSQVTPESHTPPTTPSITKGKGIRLTMALLWWNFQHFFSCRNEVSCYSTSPEEKSSHGCNYASADRFPFDKINFSRISASKSDR